MYVNFVVVLRQMPQMFVIFSTSVSTALSLMKERVVFLTNFCKILIAGIIIKKKKSKLAVRPSLITIVIFVSF